MLYADLRNTYFLPVICLISYTHVGYLIRYLRQGWRLSRMMDVDSRVAFTGLGHNVV
jgi:hypothetical protein